MVYRAFILTQVRCQRDIIGQELIKLKTTYYTIPLAKVFGIAHSYLIAFFFHKAPGLTLAKYMPSSKSISKFSDFELSRLLLFL
jgi:molybdate-binding protein